MARTRPPGSSPSPRAPVGTALTETVTAGLCLNVGCGDVPAGAGWVDCDSWPGVSPDVLMDATEPWPFATGSATRIYLGQVIEHLAYPSGVRACLSEAARVLAADGVACLVTPDFAAHSEKRVPAEVVENERRGRRRWPGDAHQWQPNRSIMVAELAAVFGDVHTVNVLNLDRNWPAGGRNPWDCCFLFGHGSPPRAS